MKILAGVAVLVLLVAVWFGIPYSPFKRQFLRDAAARAQAAQLRTNGGLYAKEDFERLPPLLQKYMEACGYIGRERKSVLAKLRDKPPGHEQKRTAPKKSAERGL